MRTQVIKSFEQLNTIVSKERFKEYLKKETIDKKSFLAKHKIFIGKNYVGHYKSELGKVEFDDLKNPFANESLMVTLLGETSDLKNGEEVKVTIELSSQETKSLSIDDFLVCKRFMNHREQLDSLPVMSRSAFEKECQQKIEINRKSRNKKKFLNKGEKNIYEFVNNYESHWQGRLKYEYIADYIPKKSGKIDSFSDKILQLKRGDDSAIQYFAELLVTYLPENQYLCVIPSSKRNGINSLELAVILKEKEQHWHIISCLKRIQDKGSYANGQAQRTLKLQYETVQCVRQEEFKGKKVILLDDIITTGKTMYACKTILKQNGVRDIRCVVLGRTVHNG